MKLCLLCFCLLSAVAVGAAESKTPEWIWHSSKSAGLREETVYFRKTFQTPPLLWNSRLTLAADDQAEVFLNGTRVASCEQWDRPLRAEVTVRLNQGENVIAVRARNRTGPAGLLAHLTLGGGEKIIVTDSSWLASTNEEPGWTMLAFNAARWTPAQSLGAHGIPPWGDVLLRAEATSPTALTVPPGFRVDLLRSADPDEGSWICFAFDGRGRIIVSPEGDARPLLRFTISDGQVTNAEKIPVPIHYAMGLLWANGRLYANAHGPSGAGLYLLEDTNGNDRFDTNEVRLLKHFDGGSEHGYHALALGPDGKIYVLNGNGTKPPQGLSLSSPHRNFADDVLSLNPDEMGDSSGAMAPAGYVVRTDLEGKTWELFMGGLRNSYDFDFSPEGELFAFDSDMEWDWGTTWYRPTRIVHMVSGGEYGWRDGTRLWPDYYDDSLPGVVNVGIGSPTGVKFGTRSHFPEKYRRALFAMDWSYGRIFAIHLAPRGASYSGSVETFLHGSPLNLTSLAFGPDGAMYFITGGRGTQSGLYRVSYSGAVSDFSWLTASQTNAAAFTARDLRRRLEQFHGAAKPGAVDFVWRHLGSDDRFIRHAARIALESQPLSEWKTRALTESNPRRGLSGLVALARMGGKEPQSELLKALEKFEFERLDDELKLAELRVLEISFSRNGRPDTSAAQALAQKFSKEYPAASFPLNRELSRLLIFLDAPNVLPKTLELIERARTQEEQFHYVAQLRNLRTGWTLPERRRFIEWWLRPREKLGHPAELVGWFQDAGRKYVDGAWVDRYLREFRADALASLSPTERTALASLIEIPFQKARSLPASNRPFVREWKLTDFAADLPAAGPARNFDRGRQVFAEAQCLVCHRFGNDGGTVGPELTGAGSKYDARSVLESILEPSKVISEQYQNTTALLKNGDTVIGRLTRRSATEVVIETDPSTGAAEKIPAKNIDQLRPSLLSPMPEGLANNFTREEILDLVAYIRSGR